MITFKARADREEKKLGGATTPSPGIITFRKRQLTLLCVFVGVFHHARKGSKRMENPIKQLVQPQSPVPVAPLVHLVINYYRNTLVLCCTSLHVTLVPTAIASAWLYVRIPWNSTSAEKCSHTLELRCLPGFLRCSVTSTSDGVSGSQNRISKVKKIFETIIEKA